MKRLIASDLHGSARFCRQLLERYQQEGAQQLILLGDLVYSGSYAPQYEYDPHQVIQLLRPLAREILWVEGNCDRGAGALGPGVSHVRRFRHRFLGGPVRLFDPWPSVWPPQSAPHRGRPGPFVRAHPHSLLAVGGRSVLRQSRLGLSAPGRVPSQLPAL